LILISLNYGSHPAVIFRHKHGRDVGSLCVDNDSLSPFLHFVEISKLRCRTEPAEYGLRVTNLRSRPCRLQDSPVDLGGLDEEPVGVEGIEHLPVDLDILEHLLVLEVASILLEIQLDRTLVRGGQLDVIHFKHVEEGCRQYEAALFYLDYDQSQ
jgi:hypothetical protein